MSKERNKGKKSNSVPSRGHIEAGRKLKSKPLSWKVPLVTLAIALIGGVPGILQCVEYFNKTSARIFYDSDNSRFIPISSRNAGLSGKTALILLRIQVVGAGEKDTHIANIATSAYYKGKWIPGTRLHPKLDEWTDAQGISKKYITVKHKKDEDTTVVTHMAWRKFEPGRYTLGYGEPTEFSYACYYNIPAEQRREITKLRIRIYDYLGSSYEIVERTESMMLEDLKDAVLLADSI